MFSRQSRVFWGVVFATAWGPPNLVAEEACPSSDVAKAIRKASGVRGGLVVHIGCGKGRLTAALCANDRYVVQGLEPDSGNVEAARDHIRSLGRYGQVSVRQWDRAWLPYGENLADLVVTRRGCPVPRAEIVRVLAPDGAAIALDERDAIVDSYRKPVPAEIDEWTHYLHDEGNNAVARDSRIGPPRHLQWKSGPLWSRSHEFASSVQALVSAGGRLIGVIDEGIIGQPRGVPALWALVARDAFNGLLLWRRPCDRIHPHALVAIGDKVYVTLQNHGPLCILDAATGQTLHTCDQTGRVSTIAFCENRLILGTELTGGKSGSGLHVVAADPDDGHILWKKAVQKLASNTVVAGSGRVCYSTGRELVCLSLESGKELWRTDMKRRLRLRGRGYAVLYKDVVFVTGGSTRAYSLQTGELLWTGPDGKPHARNPPGLFGIDGLIWTAWGRVSPRSFLWQHEEEVRNGYDPRTGEVKKTVTAHRLVTAGHHIRCYPPKATERYLLLNKRGVEFFDLGGKHHMRANWTRAACGFGMLPANGFLYATPSQCFCYQGVLLTGMNALAPAREDTQRRMAAREPGGRVARGPAYDRIARTQAGAEEDTADWPTYRHDVFRSGGIDVSLPVHWKRMWTTSLCPPAFGPKTDQAAGKREDLLLLKASDAMIHGKGARRSGEAIVAWRGADTFITWDVRIDKAGKQPVWICQANQGKGGSVFELFVGDQKRTAKIRHTETWNDYVWVRVGEVEIPKAGPYLVSVKPIKQVEGRLGNVSAVAIGGGKPPPWPTARPELREYPKGGLTPPVAAAGKLFVAETDAHAVHAIALDDGKRSWTFTADGRVDSPPTIYRGMCLFGSTDGHVYCLDAKDGRLAWRFRAAPAERQICAMGQVESVWPAHGSVLVRDGKVYVTAGRSSYLDGGIRVYALNPRSGKILHEALLKSDEPDVSKYGGRPFDMEGAKSDILTAGKEDIYLFQVRFGPDLTRKPMPRITKLGDRLGEPHLMTNDGFLDKEWFNRTYWSYSERWPGYYFTYRAPKSGQILVFDDTATYALKVYTERYGHSPEFRPGTGYRLIADRNTTKPVLDVMDIGAEKGRGFSRTELPIWAKKVPIRAHGLLLAREHLYLVGPPDLAPDEGAYEAMIGKRGSRFRVVSTANGATLAEFEMKEVPVFDGLIAAGERLYMSTMDGTVVCLGAKK